MHNITVPRKLKVLILQGSTRRGRARQFTIHSLKALRQPSQKIIHYIHFIVSIRYIKNDHTVNMFLKHDV